MQNKGGNWIHGKSGAESVMNDFKWVSTRKNRTGWVICRRPAAIVIFLIFVLKMCELVSFASKLKFKCVSKDIC